MHVQGTRTSKFGEEVSDATLVKTVLAGDSDAYGELYRRHVSSVAGYIARRTPPQAPREDLVQEAFTQALERLGEFREDAPERKSFGQWLCGIAGCVLFREAKVLWRARQAREVSVDALERELRDELAEAPAEVELPVELTAKVAALRPKYRRAVELHYLEGLSVEQTATVMGLSANWVERIITRALKELRPASVKVQSSAAKAALTRARLLEAARQVIAERGVKGATSTEIAGRVRVDPASVNHHFGSRAGLLAQAMGTHPDAIAA